MWSPSYLCWASLTLLPYHCVETAPMNGGASVSEDAAACAAVDATAATGEDDCLSVNLFNTTGEACLVAKFA